MKFPRPLRLLVSSLALASPALAQCEEARLTASDADILDYFGYVVAISGDVAAVTADKDDDGGLDAGAVYVFERSGTAWTEVQKLVPNDIGDYDRFGAALAVDNGRIAVGAIGADGFVPGTGAVYIFERVASVWTQTTKIAHMFSLEGDEFGSAVSLDDNMLLVGAPTHDYLGSVNTGRAYLYRNLVGTWTQVDVLISSDAQENDNFGGAVAIDGSRLVVAARHHNGLATNTGAGYVFEDGAQGWTEVARLEAPDAEASDDYGRSIDLAADRVVVGATWDDDLGISSGSAYIFVRESTGWVFEEKLLAPDGAAEQRFGDAVSFNSDAGRLLVGAYWDDDGGNNAGAAYVFSRAGTSWSLHQKIVVSDAEAMDRLGDSVCLDGDRAFLGAARTDDDGNRSGSAYIIDISPAVTSYCEAGINSTGAGTRLTTSGCAKISVNSFSLRAEPAPPMQPGLFYYGPNALQVAFGDGFRCVGGNVYRLYPFAQSGPEGVFTWDVDVTHSPGGMAGGGQIDAGVTWHFQVWFRDPDTVGSGFNLSDAIAVTFAP